MVSPSSPSQEGQTSFTFFGGWEENSALPTQGGQRSLRGSPVRQGRSPSSMPTTGSLEEPSLTDDDGNPAGSGEGDEESLLATTENENEDKRHGDGYSQ